MQTIPKNLTFTIICLSREYCSLLGYDMYQIKVYDNGKLKKCVYKKGVSESLKIAQKMKGC